jgi:hypothetical protein
MRKRKRCAWCCFASRTQAHLRHLAMRISRSNSGQMKAVKTAPSSSAFHGNYTKVRADKDHETQRKETIMDVISLNSELVHFTSFGSEPIPLDETYACTARLLGLVGSPLNREEVASEITRCLCVGGDTPTDEVVDGVMQAAERIGATKSKGDENAA